MKLPHLVVQTKLRVEAANTNPASRVKLASHGNELAKSTAAMPKATTDATASPTGT
jgi:hypothetical protein